MVYTCAINAQNLVDVGACMCDWFAFYCAVSAGHCLYLGVLIMVPS